MTAAYCHCTDCRSATGAPVAAFAAVGEGTVTTTGPVKQIEATPGVQRQFCHICGAPLTASLPYLPGHVCVPVGVMDDPDDLAPNIRSHAASKLSWRHLSYDLPRETGSARTETCSYGLADRA